MIVSSEIFQMKKERVWGTREKERNMKSEREREREKE